MESFWSAKCQTMMALPRGVTDVVCNDCRIVPISLLVAAESALLSGAESGGAAGWTDWHHVTVAVITEP